ncbi:MAG: hypothetical protein K2N40_01320, partial [Ureaplasma sp.]|nr:hypothetical protein [Ureaplasma sp.]
SNNVDYNIIKVTRVFNEIANNIHLFYMPCFVWLLTFGYCSPAKNKALDIGINIFVILALLWLTSGQCLYSVEYTIIYKNDINAVQTYNTSVNIILGLFGLGMGLDLAYISYHIFLKTRKYKWWFVLPILFILAVSFNIMSHYFLKTIFFPIVFCLNMVVVIILVILLKDYITDSE